LLHREGVDGSSPSEGSAKAPDIGAFSFGTICSSSNVRWVWSRLWSFQFQKRVRGRVSSSNNYARPETPNALNGSERPHWQRHEWTSNSDRGDTEIRELVDAVACRDRSVSR